MKGKCRAPLSTVAQISLISKLASLRKIDGLVANNDYDERRNGDTYLLTNKSVRVLLTVLRTVEEIIRQSNEPNTSQIPEATTDYTVAKYKTHLQPSFQHRFPPYGPYRQSPPPQVAL